MNRKLICGIAIGVLVSYMSVSLILYATKVVKLDGINVACTVVPFILLVICAVLLLSCKSSKYHQKLKEDSPVAKSEADLETELKANIEAKLEEFKKVKPEVLEEMEKIAECCEEIRTYMENKEAEMEELRREVYSNDLIFPCVQGFKLLLVKGVMEPYIRCSRRIKLGSSVLGQSMSSLNVALYSKELGQVSVSDEVNAGHIKEKLEEVSRGYCALEEHGEPWRFMRRLVRVLDCEGLALRETEYLRMCKLGKEKIEELGSYVHGEMSDVTTGNVGHCSCSR
ncbi:MAG: hypothetical protein ACTJLM_04820 [Ehrlichia sp.]